MSDWSGTIGNRSEARSRPAGNSEQAHDVGVTIDLTIAPLVELDPVLPTPTPKCLAAPILPTLARVRNAE
jgi:hypothetical protein